MSAFRLDTHVEELTANGAVPAPTVEISCPLARIEPATSSLFPGVAVPIPTKDPLL